LGAEGERFLAGQTDDEDEDPPPGEPPL
jgi:hypothetical protein